MNDILNTDTEADPLGMNTAPPEAEDEPPRKRRGRPPNKAGPREEKPAKKPAKSDVKELAEKLSFIHAMGATFFGQPLLNLQEEECQSLAKALSDVMSQYNFAIDPKIAVWIQLLAVSSAIYGPRIAMLFAAAKAAKAAKPPPPPKQTASQAQGNGQRRANFAAADIGGIPIVQ
jgi:hypothetical protein